MAFGPSREGSGSAELTAAPQRRQHLRMHKGEGDQRDEGGTEKLNGAWESNSCSWSQWRGRAALCRDATRGPGGSIAEHGMANTTKGSASSITEHGTSW